MTLNKAGYPTPREVRRHLARKTASHQSRERLKEWLCSINNNPELVEKDIARLIRLQSRLHRFYLQACNGPQLNECDLRDEKMLEDNIEGLFNGYGLHVEFNSDPRGNPVFIHDGSPEGKREPNNDMGQRGWAIW